MFPRSRSGLLLALACLLPPTRTLQAADPGTPAIVALVGGGDLQELARDGRLEAHLRFSRADTPFTFRCLAWEGDTVFSQPRDVNYPDPVGQMEDLQPRLVLVQFGRMESLDPSVHADRFGAALGQLLDRMQPVTARRVVIGPLPFEDAPGLPPGTAAQRNTRLSAFNAAAREAARQRNLPFIDLSDSLARTGEAAPRHTRDGIQLSEAGCGTTAQALARALLQASSDTPGSPGSDRLADGPVLETLLPEIREKNRLWEHHRRPTNWAFLAGDRTEQAFGRDPVDRNRRALAEETRAWLPLVEQADQRVESLLQRLRPPEATR